MGLQQCGEWSSYRGMEFYNAMTADQGQPIMDATPAQGRDSGVFPAYSFFQIQDWIQDGSEKRFLSSS